MATLSSWSARLGAVSVRRIQSLSDPPTNRVDSSLQSRWSKRTLIWLLILCAALPYVNTLFNDFVYDDSTQVLGNAYIRSFRYLPEIFTTGVWSFVGASGTTNYYRPMMTLGYLLCYKLFGPTAFWFHLANLLLHAAVVCLLFLVTVRMFRDRTLAVAAAATFGLHPVHTESVAWISAATELELAFFFLLAFWFFLGLARPGGGCSERGKLAMVASFMLALFSKEQAMMLPFLATVYEHFYRDDVAETTRAQKFSRYGVLWLLAVAYILIRIRFLGTFAPVARFPDLTWYQAFLSAIALIGQYLWKLFWPVRLCAFYVFHKSVSLLDPRVAFGFGGLMLCVALFDSLWRRARLASFGLVWLLATLAPVLNAHWVGESVFAERYLYLPSVGFCWVVAWGVVALWTWARVSSRKAVWRTAVVTALGGVALLYVLRIVTRNYEWRNNLALYTSTLATSPDAHDIRTNLAAVYASQGDLLGAERECREAVNLDPDNALALNCLGGVYLKQGRHANAVAYFQRAVQLNPKEARIHSNLGLTYVEMGLLDQAELQFRATVALAPLNSGAYSGLGVVYWRKGEHDRAESAFKRALSINPSDADTHLSLADFYAANGRAAEAIREYQAGLKIDPSNPEALAALQKLTTPRNPDTKSSKP